MRNIKTLKMLIQSNSLRIIELLDIIDESKLDWNTTDCRSYKLRAELKSKMSELRRDTIELQKVMSFNYGN